MVPIIVAGVSLFSALWAAHEYDKKKVREEAYDHGLKKGNIETKKKYVELIEEKDKYAKGAYALAICAANIDGFINLAENDEIQQVVGKLQNEIQGEGLVNELKIIFEEKPNFSTVCDKYLKDIDRNSKKGQDLLKHLDEMVRSILYAAYNGKAIPDGSKEDNFYNQEWLPFKERGYYKILNPLSANQRKQILKYINESRTNAAIYYIQSLEMQGYDVDSFKSLLNLDSQISLVPKNRGKSLSEHSKKQITMYLAEGRYVAAKAYIESLELQGFDVSQYKAKA